MNDLINKISACKDLKKIRSAIAILANRLNKRLKPCEKEALKKELHKALFASISTRKLRMNVLSVCIVSRKATPFYMRRFCKIGRVLSFMKCTKRKSKTTTCTILWLCLIMSLPIITICCVDGGKTRSGRCC